jgi:2'-deoxynucleoside 5'-phosphate N-hydrolase
MNIYFSCSITGGRDDQPVYAALVDYLLERGHEVPTAILARPEVMADEGVVKPEDVYDRDVRWVTGCDALIAEVSTPSHGVGYEIALALALGKPVLCVYQEGRRVSKMLTGNQHPNIRVATYRTTDECLKLVEEFVSPMG